jgi:Plavaka transposase
MAYPVYLTIGNIPKHIRRKPSRQGQVLLAYLPTSKLDHITNKASRRRCMSNLFHYCMRSIIKPLEKAGREGINLVSGDGAVRRCYPILAAYVGDYPEQLLVSIVKSGNCPVCPAPREDIENWDNILEPRDTCGIIDALNSISQGATEFTKACADKGIKPVQCVFWKDLPFVNIYSSIMPDILHQLFQGILKHLIVWIRVACGDAEIDARCRRLPPNHHIRLFMNGISHLNRVTGTEHDQISRFLLALVADIRLPSGHSNAKLVRSVRSVLDFIYLARYPIHTSETAAQMHNALHTFHQNRDIFISLGIRKHFNIPKLHNAGHYYQFIQLYGTTDNFNTEYTERLHIDLAKDAYASTNFKDEFPQMTVWLDRKERIMHHAKYIRRHLDKSLNTPLHVIKPLPSLVPKRHQQMAKHPTHRGVLIDDICKSYGATDFIPALSRFIAQYQHPEYSKVQIEALSESIHIPFSKISVFHRLKFFMYDAYSLNPLDEVVIDSIHVDPLHFDKYGRVVPGRFDTAIIQFRDASNELDINGTSFLLGFYTQSFTNWFTLYYI